VDAPQSFSHADRFLIERGLRICWHPSTNRHRKDGFYIAFATLNGTEAKLNTGQLAIGVKF
jgi:hypothetical protein